MSRTGTLRLQIQRTEEPETKTIKQTNEIKL
jgi:hypothetical protein